MPFLKMFLNLDSSLQDQEREIFWKYGGFFHSFQMHSEPIGESVPDFHDEGQLQIITSRNVPPKNKISNYFTDSYLEKGNQGNKPVKNYDF